jgi:hypothetical protein
MRSYLRCRRFLVLVGIVIGVAMFWSGKVNKECRVRQDPFRGRKSEVARFWERTSPP